MGRKSPWNELNSGGITFPNNDRGLRIKHLELVVCVQNGYAAVRYPLACDCRCICFQGSRQRRDDLEHLIELCDLHRRLEESDNCRTRAATLTHQSHWVKGKTWYVGVLI